ncbi:MAG: hypothetical protein KDK39_18085 [Leptospiraceae bacterium]|nr:hypothetical protein [Leptospiraceae bacterium]
MTGEKAAYFIGLGGSGMMPLALLARKKGWQVAGSDPKINPARLALLQREGIQWYSTPDPGQIQSGTDCIVYSTAIQDSHPELEYARLKAHDQHWKVFHRMEFMQHLLANKSQQFGIAGTHGKTSTSSLGGWLLLQAGLEPDIIVGGHPLYLEGQIHAGQGDVALYETDESDGSFLKARAQNRLVLNIDLDHLDYHGTFAKLQAAYVQFIRGADLAVLNADDPVLRKYLLHPAQFDLQADQLWWYSMDPHNTHDFGPELQRRGIQAGPLPNSDSLQITSVCGDVADHRLQLPVPGLHFASNALGLLFLLRIALPAVALEELLYYMETYPGVERRMEQIGSMHNGSVAVYDDYAHHPVEIAAVLQALRLRLPDQARLHVIFQPHRYTRTQELFRQFAHSLIAADTVSLLPLYAAGETPLEGISSLTILQAISAIQADQAGSVQVTLINENDYDAVFQLAQPGDIIACLGAGSISEQVRAYLQSRS